MTKRLLTLLLLLASLLSVSKASPLLPEDTLGVKVMRDIYASAPDTIFPLLTKNNRLDQIDFRENNMKAEVKNRFDDRSELLVLTDRYLKLQLSERCLVEMKLLGWR